MSHNLRGKKQHSLLILKRVLHLLVVTLQIVTRTDAEGSINTGTRQVLVTEDITSSLTTNLQRFTCTTSTAVVKISELLV